jgi:uncharacterized membrane protein YcaP (DUF421 family)
MDGQAAPAGNGRSWLVPALGSGTFRAEGCPMEKLFAVNWTEFFIPTHSLAEIIVRGSFMYLALFLILRFLLQRQSSAIGLADVLVIVLIADAAQDALAKGYKSVTEGVLLVLTIVFWDFAIDWLGYRFKSLAFLTRPPPIPLVENGQMVARNMRREMITKEELLSQIREQGLSGLDEVKSACLEGNGQISVIKRNGKREARPSKKKQAKA